MDDLDCICRVWNVFFFTTGGKTTLVQTGQISFITVFLPHMIFGSWAVLSVCFDLISADREHNVLDCILCSGISKSVIYGSKLLLMMVLGFILSLIYLTPVTFVIAVIGKDAGLILTMSRYLLPLWGYIMVYSSLGLLISVAARSSKSALIWSLAIWLMFMPRFFVMIIEGIGNVIGWTKTTVDAVSMLAPGVMMQALSGTDGSSKLLQAILIFSLSTICFAGLAYIIFSKQDELSYGE